MGVVTRRPFNTEERAAALLEEYRSDPDKVREADESRFGCLAVSQYDEIETALADLHGIDADKLIGSDALVRVLRMAKLCAEARERELRKMADFAAEAEAYSIEYDRAEMASWEDAA